jgi:hypothetical protein
MACSSFTVTAISRLSIRMSLLRAELAPALAAGLRREVVLAVGVRVDLDAVAMENSSCSCK